MILPTKIAVIGAGSQRLRGSTLAPVAHPLGPPGRARTSRAERPTGQQPAVPVTALWPAGAAVEESAERSFGPAEACAGRVHTDRCSRAAGGTPRARVSEHAQESQEPLTGGRTRWRKRGTMR